MSSQPLTQLRTWLASQGLDAFLVTQPQNRSYLSGWLNDDDEGAGMLLVGQQQQLLFTNPLYKEVAEKEATGWQVIVPEAREYMPVIVDVARELGWQKIGFEADAMTVAEFEKLYAAGQNVFTLQSFEESFVSTLRIVKQPREVELLKRAIAITDQTFAYICRWVEPGMTEKEIEWEILRYMVELGADGPSFEPIVASGPHGSMPHAHPGQRRIQRGELITIDMGARYQGYCADMTRTICLGEPAEPRMLEIYNAVLKALPDLRDSWSVFGNVYLNNRGFFAPYPIFGEGIGLVAAAFVLVTVTVLLLSFTSIAPVTALVYRSTKPQHFQNVHPMT